MRVYEELFIVKPDAVEEEVDGFVDLLVSVANHGGSHAAAEGHALQHPLDFAGPHQFLE